MRKKFFAACASALASLFCFSACDLLTNFGKDSSEDSALAEISAITDLEDERYVNLYGRNFYNENLEGMTFVNSASGFEVHFKGTQLKASVRSIVGTDARFQKSVFSVFVDGEKGSNAKIVSVTAIHGKYEDVVFVDGLSEGEHTVKILKRTPSNRDTCVVESIETDGAFLAAPERPKIKLDIYGDSITCGEGVMREVTYDQTTGTYSDSAVYTADTQNVFQSYAGVAARELDAEFRVFGRGGISMKYTTGTTLTVGGNYKSMAVDMTVGKDCPEYDYNSYAPDAVVIYLGTNDFRLGTAENNYSLTGLKAAFIQFIDNVVGTYYGTDMPIFLCYGMMAPDSGLDNCMEGVKTALKIKYPNIDTVAFDAGVTAPWGHPVLEESETAGKLLAGKIQEKLNNL